MAFGAEYGPLTVASAFTLSKASSAVSATALQYVEALEAISRRSGKLIQDNSRLCVMITGRGISHQLNIMYSIGTSRKG